MKALFIIDMQWDYLWKILKQELCSLVGAINNAVKLSAQYRIPIYVFEVWSKHPTIPHIKKNLPEDFTLLYKKTASVFETTDIYWKLKKQRDNRFVYHRGTVFSMRLRQRKRCFVMWF